MLSEFLTFRIRHLSIIYSITYIMLGYFRELLLIPVLSLSNINMNAIPYCVELGSLSKYFLLNFTFNGILELAILYLSANSAFNFFDNKKYSSKFIFDLHFLKVGFLMIAFTDKSLPRLNERSTIFCQHTCNMFLLFNQKSQPPF